MKPAFLLSLTVALAFGGGSPGIRPRADVVDYPMHQTGPDVTIGAAVIPASAVRKIFATSFDSAGYIVIEVGVFPAEGKTVDLSPNDFTLRVDANSISERPADAEAIAAIVTKGDRTYSRSTAPISTTAVGRIGIGSGVDPATGQRLPTGAGAGVGVGTGGPISADCRTIGCDAPLPAPPADAPSAERKRAQIEQELWEKSLPDGATTKPVAGYLYFPKPSAKAKNSAWVLQWDAAAGRVKVEVQSAAKH
jgi:hypothetical protein